MESIRPSVTVVIPASDPGTPLLTLLRGLRRETDYRILVVDDGSGPNSDETLRLAESYATVLRHNHPRGRGSALRTAFSHLYESGDPDGVIVTADADGQYSVTDIRRVVNVAFRRGGVVLGRRKFTGKVPLRTKVGNWFARFGFRLATGLGLHDTQTGLRAFPASLLLFFMRVQGRRYEYEMQALLACARAHLDVSEVLIHSTYSREALRRFHPVRDSWCVYREILKYSFSSFTAFLIDFIVFNLLVLILEIWQVAHYVTISNIAARVVSAGTNFAINRRLVFKNRDSIVRTGIKFFMVAAFILLLNTLLLNFMVTYILHNAMISKIIVEMTLFFVNWTMQKLFVFGGKSKKTVEVDE